MEIVDIKQDICLALFDDTYKNVSTLLNLVAKAYNEGLIEQKPEYKVLITINSALNSNDISVLKTLTKYEGQKFNDLLYDAYKESLYATFESIKSACYNFDDNDFDNNLTNETGIPIYNIKKLPKKLLVNVSRFEKNANIKTPELKKMLELYVDERSNKDNVQDYKSLSFIDNNDIKVFRNLNNYVTFVYPPNIPNELLITVANKDAWVKFKDKHVYSNIAPNFSNYQTLLDSTNDFNEVAVLRKDPYGEQEIKPIAIFCSQNISENEKQIAKLLNIPIIFSETQYVEKKYSKKKSFDYYNIKDNDIVKYDFDENF